MAEPSELEQYAIAAAQKRGLDPKVFTRMLVQESGWNPRAVSPAGAAGVAQLMPMHWARLPSGDPFNAQESIDYAADLLASHLKQFGSYQLALAAYNAGPGAVQKFGGVPPYEETQRYIRAILGGEGVAMPPALPSFSGLLSANVDGPLQQFLARASRLLEPQRGNDSRILGSSFKQDLDTLLARLLG